MLLWAWGGWPVLTMYLGGSTAGRTDVSGDPGASHSHSWEEGREERQRNTRWTDRETLPLFSLGLNEIIRKAYKGCNSHK